MFCTFHCNQDKLNFLHIHHLCTRSHNSSLSTFAKYIHLNIHQYSYHYIYYNQLKRCILHNSCQYKFRMFCSFFGFHKLNCMCYAMYLSSSFLHKKNTGSILKLSYKSSNFLCILSKLLSSNKIHHCSYNIDLQFSMSSYCKNNGTISMTEKNYHSNSKTLDKMYIN